MGSALLTFILLLSFPAASWARWATPDDAEAAIELMKQTYDVKADGTFQFETEVVTRILRESARQLSTYRLNYNSRASTLEVVKAETWNEEDSKTVKTEVENQYIVDKPAVSQMTPGFDQGNLVTIAFPKVTIGSQLYLKQRRRIKEVAIPNHFSRKIDFGAGEYIKSAQVRFRSERPLFVQKQDPEQKLNIKESRDGKSYVLEIELTAPLYTRAVDEASPWIHPRRMTSIVVSTHKTMEALGTDVVGHYERAIQAPLPSLFEPILHAAAKKNIPIEQLNTVTSLLAAELRYMGDWRPVNGGHIPRPIETIVQTKFGDCKDMSTVTSAILRKLGWKANVAWIERGHFSTPLPQLALDSAFNHAIVRAESKKGEVFWLDPTNFASFAQGVPEDIMGRQSLVLDPEHLRLEETPQGNSRSAVLVREERIKFSADDTAAVTTNLSLSGRMAVGFTGAELRSSKQQLDHMIATMLVDESRLLWKKIEPYEFSSRVVRDFSLHIKHGERSASLRTTVGPAFYLEQRAVDFLIRMETDRRVSDLYLGPPQLTEVVQYYDSIVPQGSSLMSCHVETPWFKVTRTWEKSKQGLVVRDRREILKSYIENADIKSKAFAKAKKTLERCFDRIVVVYKLSKPEARSLSSESP